MEKISGIYCILNTVNNKPYIGKSNNIYKRWRDEKYGLKNKIFHNRHLQRAWDLYGEKFFEFYIVEQCTEDILSDREKFWIEYYDAYYNGYNQTLGGEGTPGVVFSDERKQKIREVHFGENNSNTRPVYCLELDQEFWGAKEYHDIYKVNRNGICECCRGKQTYCGRLQDGTRLHWCYLDDKDSFITPLIKRETPVYCFELDEIFINAYAAENDPRILKAHSGNIGLCCKGHKQHKTCGALVDGTRLTWRYATLEEIGNLQIAA